MAADRKLIPGKFVWFELVTGDAKKAQAFYGEVLGWKAQAFPMGTTSYDMILAGDTLDTMIGGYAPARDGGPARWLSYLSVEDVDAAVKAAAANGGTVVEPPSEVPGVGRRARIADPLGAELCPFRNAAGDPPDAPTAGPGRFFWNELHTSDPERVLPFYDKVIGYAHRALGMGPGDTYHILSHGGIDRAGATRHLAPGVAPHWLPYVAVEDVDATIARARALGAAIPVPPEEIPGIGRFGVLRDPAGAVLAVMKPLPRAK
jgi:predicted enzyme related to lactoylglutathione lyase